MSKSPITGKERRFFYAVRTTVGQEYNIALILEGRATGMKIPIYSILVVEGLRGFVFIETKSPAYVDKLIYGLKYVKGRVGGVLKYEDIARFVKPKPVIEEIEVNDIVEIVGGPFRGMRGRVTHVDKARKEVVVELLEASFPMPTTIDADYVRIIEKASKASEKEKAEE